MWVAITLSSLALLAVAAAGGFYLGADSRPSDQEVGQRLAAETAKEKQRGSDAMKTALERQRKSMRRRYAKEIAAEAEQAKIQGYSTGQQQGFGAGKAAGVGEGQKAGMEQGKKAGLSEGKKKGRREGRAEGYGEGYGEGFDEGTCYDQDYEYVC